MRSDGKLRQARHLLQMRRSETWEPETFKESSLQRKEFRICGLGLLLRLLYLLDAVVNPQNGNGCFTGVFEGLYLGHCRLKNASGEVISGPTVFKIQSRIFPICPSV